MHPRIPTLFIAAALAGAAQAQDGGVYQAENGLLVAEIESHPATTGWAVETIDPGYTFQSYYRWDGGDLFDTPGNGIMTFRVNVDQGGFWRLSLRNKHDDPDDTEENDVWVRADGGTWFKLFSNGPGTVEMWNWDSRFDIDHNNQPDAGWGLAIGEHTIEFSGRSQNFKMDRFHLYKEGHPDANNENAPESVALLGASYCGPANPNSTGLPGEINVWGSTFVAKNDVTLEAVQLPPNKFGYFIASDTQDFIPMPGGSQGNLCLGGTIARYASNVLDTGALGEASLTIDLGTIPQYAPLQPGETFNFQLWHRDNNPTVTSNFTDGRSVLFQ